MAVRIRAGQIITADALNDPEGSCVEYQSITANAGPTSGTTELVFITSGTVLFETGRAYRLTIKSLASNNQPNGNFIMRIRKTNVSGAILVDQVRWGQLVAAANVPVYFSNIVTNTTGADINAALVATVQRSGAVAGDTSVAASTTSPSYIEVIDAGSSDNYPSATAIT